MNPWVVDADIEDSEMGRLHAQADVYLCFLCM